MKQSISYFHQLSNNVYLESNEKVFKQSLQWFTIDEQFTLLALNSITQPIFIWSNSTKKTTEQCMWWCGFKVSEFATQRDWSTVPVLSWEPQFRAKSLALMHSTKNEVFH